MKFANFRFLSIILLSAAFASGCRSTGSEFLGKWANKANPNDQFEVVRNGHEFLIVGQGKKIGAIYMDGALEVRGELLPVNLTYVRQTDTVLGPGFFGEIEYKRQK